MNTIYADSDYTDLIWMEFEGPTWTEYNELLDSLSQIVEVAVEPLCLIFVPAIDMPGGNPLPHIRRLINFLHPDSKLAEMIVVLPAWMSIASMMLRITAKLFHLNMTHVQVAVSLDEAKALYKAYQHDVMKQRSA